MRILHVVDDLSPQMGGVARAVLEFAHVSLAQADDVDVVCVGPLTSVSSDIIVRQFGGQGRQRWSRSGDLKKWLVENVNHYDLVNIHGVFHFPAFYAAWACSRRNVPYTVFPHGSLDPFDLRKHAIAKRLVGPVMIRIILDRARCVIATSPEEAHRLKTFGSSVARRWAYLPIRPTCGRATSPVVDSREKRLLFLGRLDYKKGLERLIHTLSDLPNEYELTIAGSGSRSYELSLQKMASSYGVEHRINWLGFVDGDSREVAWAAADAFVLNSDNENFGIAVLEAAQHGLPLILSPDVYIAREFEVAQAAVAPSQEVAALREAIEYVFEGDRRKVMGQAAQEAAFDKFSYARSSTAFVALLHEVRAK